MILTSIRKTLGASHRALRVKLFGNNQSAMVNLNYRRYYAKAKAIWAKARQPSNSEKILHSIARLHDEGYVQLAPTLDRATLEHVKGQSDLAFANPEACMSPIDGAIRLKDGIRKLPEITKFYTDEIVQTIENYYQSFFKIYWVQVYRTEPTDKQPDASFLWHVDNCPPQVLKLMVYITDTKENTGAFRLKPRPLSRQLIDRGFWDRSKNHRFADVLNDNSTTQVFEGPKGTSILFQNWGCVHRAKHPEIDHRDVAVFFMMPSLVPWDQHLAQVQDNLSARDDVCKNPALA
jgi:hypothetical protein